MPNVPRSGAEGAADIMKILSVVGARPNFMKIAPIISAIRDHNRSGLQPDSGRVSPAIQHVLVHTGQHYDKRMSEAFFSDLDLPDPDVFLGVGSGSHAVQTAEIMKKFEEVLLREKPDVVVVVGDVNSTLACSLVASKSSYDCNGSRPLVAHVEAGLRSFDRGMPEEVNRILTDHVSDMLFVSEASGITNLKNEGIDETKIFFVGNTMIDTLLANQEKSSTSPILNHLGLERSIGRNVGGNGRGSVSPFGLVTLHRPSNVDNRANFAKIIEALADFACEMDLIFPVHPRTQNRIREFGLQGHFDFSMLDLPASAQAGSGSGGRIRLTNPVGYIDFLCLMKNARVVVTDSGGIQEETTCLRVPCVTVRENTERPVTITQGTNVLAGVDKRKIIDAVNFQLGRKFTNGVPERWDGKTAARIVEIISRHPGATSQPHRDVEKK